LSQGGFIFSHESIGTRLLAQPYFLAPWPAQIDTNIAMAVNIFRKVAQLDAAAAILEPERNHR
jgi:hypothetical protein